MGQVFEDNTGSREDKVAFSLENAMNRLDEVRQVFGAEHHILENSADFIEEETKARSNLDDAKMNQLDVVSVQAETSDIVLRWSGPGKEVQVAGDFSNWEGLNMALDQDFSQAEMSDLVQCWSIRLKLKNKVHRLHFLVDGVRVLSDDLDKDALPGGGEPTNLIVVGPDNATAEPDSVSEQIIAATSLQPSRCEPFDQIEIPMIRTEEEQMRVFLGTKTGEKPEKMMIPFVRSEEEQLRVFCGIKRPDESESFINDAVIDVNSLESVREYADARFPVAEVHGTDDVMLSLNRALDKVENVKEALCSNDGFNDIKILDQDKTREIPKETETTKEIQARMAADTKRLPEEATEQERKEAERKAAEAAEVKRVAEEAAEEARKEAERKAAEEAEEARKAAEAAEAKRSAEERAEEERKEAERKAAEEAEEA